MALAGGSCSSFLFLTWDSKICSAASCLMAIFVYAVLASTHEESPASSGSGTPHYSHDSHQREQNYDDFSCCRYDPRNHDYIQNAYKRYDVRTVPFIPDCVLKVIFPSGVEAHLGNNVSVADTEQQPTPCYKAPPEKLFTFMVVSGKALAAEAVPERAFLYELIMGIPGNEISCGITFAPYQQAPLAPIANIRPYILLFLLYEHTECTTIPEPGELAVSLAVRDVFFPDNFAHLYNLKIVAANLARINSVK